MTSFREDHAVCPPGPARAASNLRCNITALLDTVAGTPLSRFASIALDEPTPDPGTGLMPGDRLDVIRRRLRAAGVTGDLDGAASSLARGGWDTWVEEIAPLLRDDPESTLSALETLARLRSNLRDLACCGGRGRE
jgi:hypothetical protein